MTRVFWYLILLDKQNLSHELIISVTFDYMSVIKDHNHNPRWLLNLLKSILFETANVFVIEIATIILIHVGRIILIFKFILILCIGLNQNKWMFETRKKYDLANNECNFYCVSLDSIYDIMHESKRPLMTENVIFDA